MEHDEAREGNTHGQSAWYEPSLIINFDESCCLLIKWAEMDEKEKREVGGGRVFVGARRGGLILGAGLANQETDLPDQNQCVGARVHQSLICGGF